MCIRDRCGGRPSRSGGTHPPDGSRPRHVPPGTVDGVGTVRTEGRRMAAEPGKRSTGKRETRDIVRLVGLAIVVILVIAISAVLGLLVDRLIIALGKRRRARK